MRYTIKSTLTPRPKRRGFTGYLVILMLENIVKRRASLCRATFCIGYLISRTNRKPMSPERVLGRPL
jgi:hypothetical protein